MSIYQQGTQEPRPQSQSNPEQEQEQEQEPEADPINDPGNEDPGSEIEPDMYQPTRKDPE